MTNEAPHPIQTLSDAVGREWPAIIKARNEAHEVREVVASALKAKLERLDSDVDFVVFGSLAREEWTSGSDIDWTLLIDGQATSDHQVTAQAVRQTLQEVEYRGKPLPSPGQTDVFGNLTFSHDLIHLIGGDADSNHNTTRRILLLLESRSIRTDDELGLRAYQRTTAGIVKRYLRNDANLLSAKSTIPRFLLNDIVRYWRTLCVDFAWKEWEQAGEKWALRNIKLRMSRKLLFASALLRVFACQEVSTEDGNEFVFDQLMKSVHHPPLQVVATVLAENELGQEAGRLFDYYNEFISTLDDESKRQRLQTLAPNGVYDDEVFLHVRDVSHKFQETLADIFFRPTSPLAKFTRDYGVF